MSSDHPSGRPLRTRHVKPAGRLIGRDMDPVVVRLGRPTTELAGGCGFPINPSYDDAYWELRGRAGKHKRD
jgi:hypothetical protein